MRRRLIRWAIWFVVAVTLGVLLGLFAEDVLGIDHLWGLGLGIGLTVVLGDIYDARRKARSYETVPGKACQ